MAIPPSAPMLMTRNLLYTGITRAKKLLIIVGMEKVVQYMIQNVDSKKRNTGLEYVTGELCYFLDSDDYIENNLIEYAVKIFENFDVDYFCFSSKAFLDGENISQDFDIIADYITVKRDGVFDINFDVGLSTNIHVWNKIFKTSKLISNNIKFIDGLLYEDIYLELYFPFSKSLL